MGVLQRNQSAKSGVLITAVVPQAAADKAGVLMNDLIREIDGRKIVSSEQVVKIVSQKDPGDVVELSLDRKDKKLKTSHCNRENRIFDCIIHPLGA